MNKRFQEILKSKNSLNEKINLRHVAKTVTAFYLKNEKKISKLPAIERNYKHRETNSATIYV